jgi:mycofactocin glycosyltransferase
LNELPVTVIVPTVGRAPQLEACLQSLANCEPRAEEVLVVDQSGSSHIEDLTRRFAGAGARYLSNSARGKSIGANAGLAHARHEVVLFTDDDCTVERSWVASASAALERDPWTIVTGRVLAPRDAGHVPSTIDDAAPNEYVGRPKVDVLYWNNMACARSALQGIGGFDESLVLAAADNDLCWRWLRAGGRIRYEPDLVVWHHDWRTAKELQRLYVRYARGQGQLYGKHLRRGDLEIGRFVLRDFVYVCRAALAAVRNRSLHPDAWALGIVRGMPRGLSEGWRSARS